MGRDDRFFQILRAGGDISIHAPRVGRDREVVKKMCREVLFQSTRPVWGATDTFQKLQINAAVISIHAPRVGRDIAEGDYKNHFAISIHAPRVGRD